MPEAPTFISYSRRDAALAARLTEDLKQRGIEVWVDQKDIAPGEAWDRAVQHALESSPRVIVLLSATSVESDNVLDEITLAVDEGKEIVPVRLEACRVPLRLRRRQYIDLAEGYQQGLEQLVLRLSEAPRSADRLQEITSPLDPGFLDRTTASIAVLPFRSLGGDSRSELLIHGLHDEITGGLSRINELRVVSSGTTRIYTDTTIDVREAARTLGVRYIVMGSLAAPGEQIRVTAELVDATTSESIWRERFDGEIGDLFEFQDLITRSVVAQLHPNLVSAEIKRIRRKTSDELSAWELTQRARVVHWSQENREEALALLRRALELDPDSAFAHAEISTVLAWLGTFGGQPEHFAASTQHIKTALRLAPSDAGALLASAAAYCLVGQWQKGLDAANRALEENPNYADAWAYSGYCLGAMGDRDEALTRVQYAIELSPRDPLLYMWHLFRAFAHVVHNDYHASVEAGEEALRLFPGNFMGQMTVAVNLCMVGEAERAREHWAEAKRLFPQVSVDFYEALARMQGRPDATLARERDVLTQSGIS